MVQPNRDVRNTSQTQLDSQGQGQILRDILIQRQQELQLTGIQLNNIYNNLHDESIPIPNTHEILFTLLRPTDRNIQLIIEPEVQRQIQILTVIQMRRQNILNRQYININTDDIDTEEEQYSYDGYESNDELRTLPDIYPIPLVRQNAQYNM